VSIFFRMAMDVTGSKARQVFDHIDGFSEQRIRAITLQNHHAQVSDRTLCALKHLASLDAVKTPVALLESMLAFQGAFPAPLEAASNGGASDVDFHYLEGLYLIRASALSQIFFIDMLALLYTRTQSYLDYWRYEEEHPVHYAITNIFWRTKQLHFLITNEAATTSRRRPQTPFSPPDQQAVAMWQPPVLLEGVVHRLRALRVWEWPWRKNLEKWSQALGNPVQFRYLLQQCFSDIVRGNVRLLDEIQRQVVEQLGHTYYLLANLTGPDTEKALGNVAKAGLHNVHEYLNSAQLSLGVVASQPTTAGLGHTDGLRRKPLLSVQEDLTLTPKEEAQDAGLPLLITVVQQTLEYRQSVLDIFDKVRPSTSRFWAHTVLASWTIYRGVKWVRNTTLTAAYVWDVVATNAVTYFVEPVQEIMATLFRSQTLELQLGENTTASEAKALESMVLAYHRDHGAPLGDADLARIRSELSRGDLGTLTQDYEACVARPVRSAVFGDMARLLLIQMQLQKLNMTQLYVTMDDVLRKNELNFNIMAALPAGMLVIFGIYAYWTTRRFRAVPVYQRIRGGLREASMRINRASGPTLHWLDQGYLLLEMAKLKALAVQLPDVELRQWFLEDLQEIEDASMTCQQRLNVVERMHRVYPFLRHD